MLTPHPHTINDVIITPYNLNCLVQLPILGNNHYSEHFKIRCRNRGMLNDFLHGIGEHIKMSGFCASLLSSGNPSGEGYFSQVRIWYENQSRSEQNKNFGDLIWDFIRSEQTWLDRQGEDVIQKVYGLNYRNKKLSVDFGMMREHGLSDSGDHFTEWRIWSYPHFTSV